MMDKPKVLLIFQNAYTRAKVKLKMRNSVYQIDELNIKNATYSRVIPHLQETFEIFCTECTPILATNNKDKFPTDLKWLESAINLKKWDLIIAFGSQAHQAINDLGIINVERLPHPVSFKWRKQLILEILDKEKLKYTI